MRVLVTGGAGYIGSVTAELLLNSGHEVFVFDNLERGHRQAVDKRCTFVEGDLRDRSKIGQTLENVKPDAVMHFAAYALVPESMKHPELYFNNNVAGCINLAEAMLEANVRKIVFSSTCATYGEPEHMPITEDTVQKPTNPYGESKLICEKIFKWYHEIHDTQTVFLRYFNVCGATDRFGEDHDPETHLIPIVLQVALGKRKSISVFGDDYNTPDGTCRRDYIHVVDLAQAHILALESDQSGAFNLGYGCGYSVAEVIETARRVTGLPIPVEKGPRRPGDPPSLIASAEKARKILGWKPAFQSLDNIVESAWNWHKAHPDGYIG